MECCPHLNGLDALCRVLSQGERGGYVKEKESGHLASSAAGHNETLESHKIFNVNMVINDSHAYAPMHHSQSWYVEQSPGPQGRLGT